MFRTGIHALRAALAVALLGAAFSATAQPFPSKPITIVVGFSAGGTTDIITRLISDELRKGLGQPIIIENKPGAAGGVAMEFIAKAPNDGYTLYYFDSGPLTVAPHISKEAARWGEVVRQAGVKAE